jgi:hypothetical protein
MLETEGNEWPVHKNLILPGIFPEYSTNENTVWELRCCERLQQASDMDPISAISSDGLEMISRLQESDDSLRDPRTDGQDTQQFQSSSTAAASAPPPIPPLPSLFRNSNIVPQLSHEELWVTLILLSPSELTLSLSPSFLTSFDLLHFSINVAAATKEHLENWKG